MDAKPVLCIERKGSGRIGKQISPNNYRFSKSLVIFIWPGEGQNFSRGSWLGQQQQELAMCPVASCIGVSGSPFCRPTRPLSYLLLAVPDLQEYDQVLGKGYTTTQKEARQFRSKTIHAKITPIP